MDRYPNIVKENNWLTTRFTSLIYQADSLEQQIYLLKNLLILKEEQFFFIENCPNKDLILESLIKERAWFILLFSLKNSLRHWNKGVLEAKELFWLIKALVIVEEKTRGEKLSWIFEKNDKKTSYDSLYLRDIWMEELLQLGANLLVNLLRLPGGPQIWAENLWFFDNEELGEILWENLSSKPVSLVLFLDACKELYGINPNSKGAFWEKYKEFWSQVKEQALKVISYSKEKINQDWGV